MTTLVSAVVNGLSGAAMTSILADCVPVDTATGVPLAPARDYMVMVRRTHPCVSPRRRTAMMCACQCVCAGTMYVSISYRRTHRSCLRSSYRGCLVWSSQCSNRATRAVSENLTTCLLLRPTILTRFGLLLGKACLSACLTCLFDVCWFILYADKAFFLIASCIHIASS